MAKLVEEENQEKAVKRTNYKSLINPKVSVLKHFQRYFTISQNHQKPKTLKPYRFKKQKTSFILA